MSGSGQAASLWEGGPRAGFGPSRALATIGLGMLGAALLYRFAVFLVTGAGAVAFPYNLDYGEGVVWQQLLLMVQGRAYGDIAAFPSLVFHYPPAYHALAALTAAATGLDQLAAGRLLSLFAALVVGGVSGALAFRALRAEAGTAPSAVCACVAGLVTFTYWPVAVWSPVMRVDMTAVACSLLGVYFGVRSPERPRLVHAAALCFVLAVYTKQTALAAPCATFFVLALVRPGLAAAGVATSVVTGGLLLAAFTLATQGGFLRHLVLYNLNRFDASQLWIIVGILAPHGCYALAAACALAEALRRLVRRGPASAGIEGLRRRVAANQRDRIVAVVAAHLALTTLMLVGVGKSGSAVNYFIEWMCVWSVPIAFSVRGAATAAVGRAPPREGAEGAPGSVRAWSPALIPAALAVQALVLPVPSDVRLRQEAMWSREMRDLVSRVANASAPVVSDDMVLVLRAGKRVVWEPAIFAELASTGRWDEGPFVDMVASRAFAFFVTSGQRGEEPFDSRYTPAVARALYEAYPRKERTAGYVVHLPAE